MLHSAGLCSSINISQDHVCGEPCSLISANSYFPSRGHQPLVSLTSEGFVCDLLCFLTCVANVRQVRPLNDLCSTPFKTCRSIVLSFPSTAWRSCVIQNPSQHTSSNQSAADRNNRQPSAINKCPRSSPFVRVRWCVMCSTLHLSAAGKEGHREW